MPDFFIIFGVFITFTFLVAICCGFCHQAKTSNPSERTRGNKAWNGHWSSNTDGGISGIAASSTTDSSWGYDTGGGGGDSGGGFCGSSGGGGDSGGGCGGGDSGGGGGGCSSTD